MTHSIVRLVGDLSGILFLFWMLAGMALSIIDGDPTHMLWGLTAGVVTIGVLFGFGFCIGLGQGLVRLFRSGGES